MPKTSIIVYHGDWIEAWTLEHEHLTDEAILTQEANRILQEYQEICEGEAQLRINPAGIQGQNTPNPKLTIQTKNTNGNWITYGTLILPSD